MDWRRQGQTHYCAAGWYTEPIRDGDSWIWGILGVTHFRNAAATEEEARAAIMRYHEDGLAEQVEEALMRQDIDEGRGSFDPTGPTGPTGIRGKTGSQGP